MNAIQKFSKSTPALFTVCVLGLIALKSVVPWFSDSPQYQPPGVERGDWDVPETCLPDSIQLWEKHGFAPGLRGNDLPEQQNWWSHTWRFANHSLSSIVAFDQLPFHGWHELTQCYQGTGWQLTNRAIVVPKQQDTVWPCVVASFRRNHTEHAVLVFSLFYIDGRIVVPLDYEEIDTYGTDLISRINNRRRHIGKSAFADEAESVQCQAFATLSREFTAVETSEVTDLHLQTRSRFRQGWLQRVEIAATSQIAEESLK